MVLADYDQQAEQIPQVSSDQKTASIRSKHSAKRVSCVELDKIENPDTKSSSTSKGKAPAPQPKDYMSPSEMRIKKYHKGKQQNGLERSSSTPNLVDGGVKKPEPVYATPQIPGDSRRSSSGAINNVYAIPGERPKAPPPPPPPPGGSTTPTPKRPAPAPPKGVDPVQPAQTEVVSISTEQRNSSYSSLSDMSVSARRKSEYESSFRPGISANLTDEPKVSTPSLQQAKLSNRTHNRHASQVSVQSSDSSGSRNSEDKPSVSFAEDKVYDSAKSFLQKHPNAQLLVTAEVYGKKSERKPSEPEPDYDAESDEEKKQNVNSTNSVTVISFGDKGDNNNAKKYTVKSDIPSGDGEKIVIPPPPSGPAPEPPKSVRKDSQQSSANATPSQHSRESSVSNVSVEESKAPPPAPPPPPAAPPAPPLPPPAPGVPSAKTPPPVAENKPKRPTGALPTGDILAAVEKRKARIETDGLKVSSGPNKELKPRNSMDLRNKLIENTQQAILEAVAKRRAKLEQTTETEVAENIESRLQKTKKLQSSKMYFSSDTIQKMDKKNANKEVSTTDSKPGAVFSSDNISKTKPPSPSVTKRAPSPKAKPENKVSPPKNKPPSPAPVKKTTKPPSPVVMRKEKSQSPVKKEINVAPVKKEENSVKVYSVKASDKTQEKDGKESPKVNGEVHGEDFVAMAEKARQDWIKKRSSSSLLLKSKPDIKANAGERSKTQAPKSPSKMSDKSDVPKTNGIVIESSSAKDKMYEKKTSATSLPSKTQTKGITPMKSARDTVMIAKATSIRARIANFEQSKVPNGGNSNPTSPHSKIPVYGVTVDSSATDNQKGGTLPPPPPEFGDNTVHLEIIPPPTGFNVSEATLDSPPYSAFHHDDSSSVSTLSTLSDDGRPKHGYEDLIAPPPPGFDDNSTSDDINPVIPPPPDFGGNKVTKSVPHLNKTAIKPFESKAVDTWQCLDVLDWLDSLGMNQYKTSFQQRCIDGKKLAGLTRNDYIQLGVTQVGHRMNLERSIKKVAAKKS